MIKTPCLQSGSNAFDGKVKKLILIGADEGKDCCRCRKMWISMIYVFADTFEEAVLLCSKVQPRVEMQCFCHRHVQVGECSRIMKYVEMNLKRIVNSL